MFNKLVKSDKNTCEGCHYFQDGNMICSDNQSCERGFIIQLVPDQFDKMRMNNQEEIFKRFEILETIRESVNKNVDDDFENFSPKFQEKAINGMYEDMKRYFK